MAAANSRLMQQLTILLSAMVGSAACAGPLEVPEQNDDGTDTSFIGSPTPVPLPNISSVAWESCDMPTEALSVPACVGGGCLDKVEIDTAIYPNAVCNDGSPGVMYIRPAPAGSADEDKWVVHLEGGAGAAGAGELLERWCGDRYYDASKMSSSWAPDQINDLGISADRADNNFSEWNQVFMYYCSSDQWTGRRRKPMIGYIGSHTTLPVDFSVEFRGHQILVAAMRTLQAGGIFIGNDALRDLDDATHLLLTGSSAGSGGVRTNGDRLRSQLRQTNPDLKMRLVLDSGVRPIEAWVNDLVYPGGVPPVVDPYVDMDDYIAQKLARDETWNAPTDESCLEAHPSDPETCASSDHLVFHHLTTPFFVRQDLDEQLPDDADPQLWAEETHAHLLELDDLLTYAEDAADMTVTPGVFAPQVGTHTSLDSPRFFDETISGLNFHDVLWNWLNGQPDTVVMETP